MTSDASIQIGCPRTNDDSFRVSPSCVVTWLGVVTYWTDRVAVINMQMTFAVFVFRKTREVIFAEASVLTSFYVENLSDPIMVGMYASLYRVGPVVSSICSLRVLPTVLIARMFKPLRSNALLVVSAEET